VRRGRVVLGAALLFAQALAAPAAAAAQNVVILKRAWVNKYQNRATIEASMTVRHGKHVNTNVKDGDFHFSGVAAQVGLPFVAEIMNARSATQMAAVTDLRAKAGGSEKVEVVGVWRLWFEHPAKKQKQGGKNAFDPDNTSPYHSFEIHPATRVGQRDLRGAFTTVAGFTPHKADVAFPFYDKAMATFKASKSGITIDSKRVVYNYVRFEIELEATPTKVDDGLIVNASIVDGDQNIVPGTRRMIFVDGTPPALAVANASGGDRFEVLGIPRVNLKRVMDLVQQNGTKQFKTSMPYEMIVVGIY